MQCMLLLTWMVLLSMGIYGLDTGHLLKIAREKLNPTLKCQVEYVGKNRLKEIEANITKEAAVIVLLLMAARGRSVLV